MPVSLCNLVQASCTLTIFHSHMQEIQLLNGRFLAISNYTPSRQLHSVQWSLALMLANQLRMLQRREGGLAHCAPLIIPWSFHSAGTMRGEIGRQTIEQPFLWFWLANATCRFCCTARSWRDVVAWPDKAGKKKKEEKQQTHTQGNFFLIPPFISNVTCNVCQPVFSYVGGRYNYIRGEKRKQKEVRTCLKIEVQHFSFTAGRPPL